MYGNSGGHVQHPAERTCGQANITNNTMSSTGNFGLATSAAATDNSGTQAYL